MDKELEEVIDAWWIRSRPGARAHDARLYDLKETIRQGVEESVERQVESAVEDFADRMRKDVAGELESAVRLPWVGDYVPEACRDDF